MDSHLIADRLVRLTPEQVAAYSLEGNIWAAQVKEGEGWKDICLVVAPTRKTRQPEHLADVAARLP